MMQVAEGERDRQPTSRSTTPRICTGIITRPAAWAWRCRNRNLLVSKSGIRDI
jgi:hypothetical protein